MSEAPELIPQQPEAPKEEKIQLESATDFTDAKKESLRARITPEGQKVLESLDYKMLQPVDVVFNLARGWESGGFIVGVENADKEDPEIIVGIPTPDGSHVAEPYAIIKKSESDRRLRPFVARQERSISEPAKDFTPETRKRILETRLPEPQQKLLERLGYQMLEPVEVLFDGGWESGYVIGVRTVPHEGILLGKPLPDGMGYHKKTVFLAADETAIRLRPVGGEPRQPSAPPVQLGSKPETLSQTEPKEPTPTDRTLEPVIQRRREQLRKRVAGLHSGEMQRLNVHITDITPYIEQISHRIAEEKVREYLNQRGGLAFLKRGLMHLSEDGYRRTFYEETMSAITANRNLMASIEARVFGRGDVTVTGEGEIHTLQILDEVLRGSEEELTSAEQRGDRFVADADLNDATSELFVQYATGQIADRAAFDLAVEARIIPLLGGKKFSQGTHANAASERENVMHASNLWHWAEGYKDQISELVETAREKYGDQSVEHVQRYLRGVLHLDVQLAKHARDVVNRAPEGKLGFFEKFASGLQRNIGWSPVNKVVGWTIGNPVLHGIIGAVATRAGVRWGATGLATLGLAATGAVVGAPLTLAIAGIAGGAATAGVLAKWRASKELKQDRGMIQRDAALGLDAGGPRAQKMHEYVQQMEEAETILTQLRALVVNDRNEQHRAEAQNVLADVRARLEIERENMIDMIRVSAEEGREFNSRIFSLHEIQRELKRCAPLMGDDAVMRAAIDARKQELLTAIEQQDSAFEQFRKHESSMRALKGAAIGAAAGVLMLGAKELFAEPFETVSHTVGSGLKRLWSSMFGSEEMPAAVVAANGVALPPTRLQEVPFAKGTLRLPSDRVFVADADGTGVIATTDGRALTPKFHIGKDGSIDSDTEQLLAENGMHIEHATQTVRGTEFSDRLAPVEFSNHAVTRHFEIPENMRLVENPDGTLDLFSKDSGKLVEAGLRMTKDGTLDDHSIDQLQEHGWNVKQGMHPSTQHLDKAGLAAFLREHYGQGKAHRLDWHGNGTPMHKVGGKWVASIKMSDELGGRTSTFESLKPLHPPAGSAWQVKHIGGRWVGADGKELMLKLEGAADSRTLSLNEMIKTAVAGKVNPDGSVDNKFADIESAVYKKEFADAAKNFRLRVFVGDNYWKSGESFELPVNAAGELDVHPGDELYNVLYDESGNLKATVEAVVPAGDGAGYHTLATAVRHGDGAGSVVHKAAYMNMSHGNTDTVRHFYNLEEHRSVSGAPTPVVPPPAPPQPQPQPDNDIPWIVPFPVPYFERREMEQSRRGESVQSARAPRSLARQSLRRDADEARRITDGFGPVAQLPPLPEPVAPVEPVRVDGEHRVEGADPISVAVRMYALKEGGLMTPAREQNLRALFNKASVAEEKKPTNWKQPFVIEAGKPYKTQMDDAELRALVSKPRPEKVHFVVSENYFDGEHLKEVEREQFMDAWRMNVAADFAALGILGATIERESDYVARTGQSRGSEPAPVERQTEKTDRRIAGVYVNKVAFDEHFTFNKFVAKEFDRLARMQKRDTLVSPVVYALDAAFVDAVKKAYSGIKTDEQVKQLFFRNLDEVDNRALRDFGIRMIATVLVNPSQDEIDKAVKALRGSSQKFDVGEVEKVKKEKARRTDSSFVSIQGVVESRGKWSPERNEDASFIDNANHVYGVFDGVGGEANGQEAAQLAAKLFSEQTTDLRSAAQSGRRDVLENALLANFGYVQMNLKSHFDGQSKKEGGTTAVISVPFIEMGETYVAVANAGDSRAYLYDGKTLQYLTRDYPLVSETIEREVRNVKDPATLSPEAAVIYARRNVVEKSLGARDNVDNIPDIKFYRVPSGKQKLVLVSDGVGDNLRDDEISEALLKPDPQRALIEAAYQRSVGTEDRAKPDDITGLVVDLDIAEQPRQQQPRPTETEERDQNRTRRPRRTGRPRRQERQQGPEAPERAA